LPGHARFGKKHSSHKTPPRRGIWQYYLPVTIKKTGFYATISPICDPPLFGDPNIIAHDYDVIVRGRDVDTT
jgi:hypothetical protein